MSPTTLWMWKKLHRRVTDVERQPFRSMGIASVISVSGIFALVSV